MPRSHGLAIGEMLISRSSAALRRLGRDDKVRGFYRTSRGPEVMAQFTGAAWPPSVAPASSGAGAGPLVQQVFPHHRWFRTHGLDGFIQLLLGDAEVLAPPADRGRVRQIDVGLCVGFLRG